MTTLLTSALIERCHAGSRAKGFWDETPPQGQQLMLVISELAEALEAHRKGKVCKLGASSSVFRPDMVAELFQGEFLTYVKDTVGDELADAYIRLCDFTGGYGLRVSSVLRHKQAETIEIDLYPGSFGEALLGVTMFVCSVHDESAQAEGVGCALAALEYIAKQEDIPLAEHVNAKLRYNATRPAKHGKAY